MGKIINEETKEWIRGKLKRSQKHCWIGGIMGAISLLYLIKFFSTGNFWLNSLAGIAFFWGTYIYEGEMRIVGYIKGYYDGYSMAANDEEIYSLDTDSVGYWRKVEV